MIHIFTSLIFFLFFLLFIPIQISAHQPRIGTGSFVEVINPEISQAFYEELKGKPIEYRILATTPFTLYVGILVPDVPKVKKDISAEIYTLKNEKKYTVALLDGTNFTWTPFYEEFAGDNYFWGPEYKADDSKKGLALKGNVVPAGDYRIRVFSPTNEGKYSLAIGYKEEFPLNEIISSTMRVPQIKRDFFDKSFFAILSSPIVLGSVLSMYLLSFIAAFVIQWMLRRLRSKKPNSIHKNIGTPDRLIRLVIAVGLFLVAIYTTWNPLLFFISGFALFEAIFSWCGLYAALGKNTCPIR